MPKIYKNNCRAQPKYGMCSNSCTGMCAAPKEGADIEVHLFIILLCLALADDKHTVNVYIPAEICSWAFPLIHDNWHGH